MHCFMGNGIETLLLDNGLNKVYYHVSVENTITSIMSHISIKFCDDLCCHFIYLLFCICDVLIVLEINKIALLMVSGDPENYSRLS